MADWHSLSTNIRLQLASEPTINTVIAVDAQHRLVGEYNAAIDPLRLDAVAAAVPPLPARRRIDDDRLVDRRRNIIYLSTVD